MWTLTTQKDNALVSPIVYVVEMSITFNNNDNNNDLLIILGKSLLDK